MTANDRSDCPQLGVMGVHCDHTDPETPCCWCGQYRKDDDDE